MGIYVGRGIDGFWILGGGDAMKLQEGWGDGVWECIEQSPSQLIDEYLQYVEWMVLVSAT